MRTGGHFRQAGPEPNTRIYLSPANERTQFPEPRSETTAYDVLYDDYTLPAGKISLAQPLKIAILGTRPKRLKRQPRWRRQIAWRFDDALDPVKIAYLRVLVVFWNTVLFILTFASKSAWRAIIMLALLVVVPIGGAVRLFSESPPLNVEPGDEILVVHHPANLTLPVPPQTAPSVPEQLAGAGYAIDGPGGIPAALKALASVTGLNTDSPAHIDTALARSKIMAMANKSLATGYPLPTWTSEAVLAAIEPADKMEIDFSIARHLNNFGSSALEKGTFPLMTWQQSRQLGRTGLQMEVAYARKNRTCFDIEITLKLGAFHSSVKNMACFN